jgi:FG-GAP-like repeat
MDGKTVTSESTIRRVSNDWEIKGVDDFNGDGKSDILWRNSATGQAYIYQMDGLNISEESSIGEPYTTPDNKKSYWNIVGAGDYNGDSKADILWRHNGGTAYIWNMDGFKTTSEQLIRIADNSWQAVSSTF